MTKVKLTDLYNGGDPNEVDTLGREIAYTLSDNPKLTALEIAAKFKVSRKIVDKRLHSKDFKAFQMRLESNIWDKIAQLRSKAMKNASGYLDRPESQAALEMTKMFLKNAAEHPSTLPAPEVAEPEFFDGKGDE